MRNPAPPLTLVSITCFAFAAHATPPAASLRGIADVRAAETRIPLAFEENQGQTDPTVRFVARMLGRRLFLTGEAAWMSGEANPDRATGPEPFRISLDGADPAATVVG